MKWLRIGAGHRDIFWLFIVGVALLMTLTSRHRGGGNAVGEGTRQCTRFKVVSPVAKKSPETRALAVVPGNDR